MGYEPIYRTEVLISRGEKNYKGIIALFEDKCIVYDDERMLDEFFYDITRTTINDGEEEVSFLDIYRKTKRYIQLIFEDKKSTHYYLNDKRIDLFIGRFEQKKAEKRNYRLVIKALEYGYVGKDNKCENSFGKNEDSSAIVEEKNKSIRHVSELNDWTDLLTPIEWRDYYDTLSEPGKKVYDAIFQGIIDYQNVVTVEGVKLTNEAVGVIYHYVLWDNPAIFCIGEYAMWKAVTEDGKHIKITSLCGGKAEESRLRRQVLDETKKVLSKKALYNYSDIQKEKYVHDYMVKNWPYDSTCGDGGARLEPYTVFGALVQRTAVCEGFAKTAKLLLDILGVHTIVISGTIVSENAGHAWNAVKISGKTYQLDITYDISETGGSQYAIRYDYFNVPDEDLIDRIWEDKQAVWICNEREHSYPACIGGLVENEEELYRYIYKEVKRNKAYLYIKLMGQLSNSKKNEAWIQKQFDGICRTIGKKVQGTVLTTDLKDYYVIAVHY